MSRESLIERISCMPGLAILRLGLSCAALVVLVGAAEATESVWAYPSSTGRMIYTPDVEGDRIADYSISGYGKGQTAIPDAPEPATLDLLLIAGVLWLPFRRRRTTFFRV